MADENEKDWVLPASLPLDELKGKDLEECVYWLLDAMGAKDLEWRKGGSGGGAADGGRDLEAHFFIPSADGELERQKWWIECKGREGTVPPEEVKTAVNNAAAIDALDHLVIVTNTQFSNPTRDWVKAWQKKNSTPKIKLWDKDQLERFLSQHPSVVLRLFARALSLKGRLRAMTSRLWNKAEWVPTSTLRELWAGSDQLELNAMDIFAAIVNEFGHGDINERPWAAILDNDDLLNVLYGGLINIGYLVARASDGGVEQRPFIRAYAYLLLASLDRMPPEHVARHVIAAIRREGDLDLPEPVQEMLLGPVVDQLLAEMQDVCSADCERMMLLDRSTLLEKNDEVKHYWMRLERDGKAATTDGDRKVLRIERMDAPCAVGFPVNKEVHCPLFSFEPKLSNTTELLSIIKRVAAFRKSEAAAQRKRTALRSQAKSRSQ